MTALVLLHGFTGSPASFTRLRTLLPAGLRAFCPALIGHDGRPEPPTSFEAELERIAALVERSGFAGSHLVGYSLGARIALGLIVRRPGLFVRATLIGCHPGLRTEAERESRRRDDEKWCALLETDGIERFVSEWQAQPLFATQNALAPELVAAQRRERLGHDPRGLATSLRSVGLGQMPDYRGLLGAASLPVTLLTGALDAKFCAVSHDLAELLPSSRKFEIEGAGHNVVLERPAAVGAALGFEPGFDSSRYEGVTS